MIIFLFKALGLAIALLGLLSVAALLRYRAMIPLMYLILLIENVGRKLMTVAGPVATSSSGGLPSFAFTINLALIRALLIGLALSLHDRPATSG